MSEAELRLVKAAKNCTIYSIQFLSEDESEFERFYAKFRDESVYNEDFERLCLSLKKVDSQQRVNNGVFTHPETVQLLR